MATAADQQASYANFINSGKATPVSAPVFATAPVVTAPNFSTGNVTSGTPSVGSPTNGAWAAPTAAASYTPAKLDNPAQWSITPAQTVQGQLDNVMNKDSLLMQSARTQGLQLAQSRNLLNSSMAVGAAQDAVIKNALPIATADANANLGSTRLNTETANNFSINNAAAQNTANSFSAQQKNNTEQFNASNQYNQASTSYDANVKASLAQIDNQFKWDTQTRQTAGDIMLQGQNMKQKVLLEAGEDFTAATKQQMFDQIDSWVVNTARLTSAAASVPDMSALLTYNSAGDVKIESAPTTYIQGQTNDPVWEQVLSDFAAGNTKPWDADPGAEEAYRFLVERYEARKASGNRYA